MLGLGVRLANGVVPSKDLTGFDRIRSNPYYQWKYHPLPMA